MSKQDAAKVVSAISRILLAFAFVFSQAAWAGQDQKTNDNADSGRNASAPQAAPIQVSPPPAKPESAAAQGPAAEAAARQSAGAEQAPSAGGPHEGIKVHGHWSIEVRNPDGSVVTHREFENSLTPSGPLGLARILSGTMSMGSWQIALSGADADMPCVDVAGGEASCNIVSSTYSPGGSRLPEYFGTLTVTEVEGSLNQVVLNGTATAGKQGDVSHVSTYILLCANTVAPSNCAVGAGLGQYPLTFTNVQSPINVATGQIIAVTVTISFS